MTQTRIQERFEQYVEENKNIVSEMRQKQAKLDQIRKEELEEEILEKSQMGFERQKILHQLSSNYAF